MKEGDSKLTNQKGGDDTYDKDIGSSDASRFLSRLENSFTFLLPLR